MAFRLMRVSLIVDNNFMRQLHSDVSQFRISVFSNVDAIALNDAFL